MTTQTQASMAQQQNEQEKHILIVDDDVATLFTIDMALKKAGFKVTSTTSGEKSLKLIDSTRFDLIILDACMPVMNGFETCKAIRNIENMSSTPIFIATGLNDDQSVNQAFTSGANDYIEKPINLNILANRIRSMFSRDSLLNTSNSKLYSALQSANDIALPVTNKLTIVTRDKKIPTSIQSTISQFNNLTELVKQCSSFNDHALSAFLNNDEESSSLFWFSTLSEESGVHFRLQLYKGENQELYLTINDETENQRALYETHKQLNFDPEFNLPNGTLLEKDMERVDMEHQINLERFGTIEIVINNLDKIQNLFGKDRASQLLDQCLTTIKVNIRDDGRKTLYRTGQNKLFITVVDCEHLEFSVFLEELSQAFTNISNNHYANAVMVKIGGCHGYYSPVTAKEMIELPILAINSNSNSTVNIYNQNIKSDIDKRSRIEKLLSRDIDRQALEVHFQPKFETRSLALCGMEALVRWNSAELGFMSPGEFIPIAESSNLMNKLSLLVIDKTLNQMKFWQSQGRNLVPVSINLDASNLTQSYVIDALVAKLKKYGLSPKLLEVELTESVLIDASSTALNNLKLLKDMGIRIAMDDFGTGYSSFSYLKTLPLDTLKIDMSFIKSIDEDPKSEAITRAIVSIGHEIGLHVIAEGVENQEQLDKLSDIGCDSVQGYLTGKPVTASSFSQFFTRSELRA